MLAILVVMLTVACCIGFGFGADEPLACGMTRRMLLGIKKRAEALRSATGDDARRARRVAA